MDPSHYDSIIEHLTACLEPHQHHKPAAHPHPPFPDAALDSLIDMVLVSIATQASSNTELAHLCAADHWDTARKL